MLYTKKRKCHAKSYHFSLQQLLIYVALTCGTGSFFLGLFQDYADEIDRLQRDLMAARSRNGIFLAPENYNEMVSRIASLDDELTEKIVELRSVIEEQAKLTVCFLSLYQGFFQH